MLDPNKLKADILEDMRVELSDEFDRNFERKGFFSDKWKPRAHDYPRGSLLMVTGAMRRSTQGEVSGNGVRFTSSEPYTSLHNEAAQVSNRLRLTPGARKREKSTLSALISDGSTCRSVSLSATARTRSASSAPL